LLSSVYFSLEPAGPLLFGRSDETPALVFEKDTRILRRLCHDYEAVVVVCMNIFCTKRKVTKAEPFLFSDFFFNNEPCTFAIFRGSLCSKSRDQMLAVSHSTEVGEQLVSNVSQSSLLVRSYACVTVCMSLLN